MNARIWEGPNACIRMIALINFDYICNMNRIITSFLAIGLLLIPAALNAQKDSSKVNQITLGLNFLTHGEICLGGLPLNSNGIEEDKSAFLMGRTRLTVGYTRPHLEARAVIQNLAIWGMSGNKALNLYEGWVKMTANNGLFAQVGRIALAYDDERIIGPDDFAAAANTHDVLRVGYEGHGHKVHLLLCYNQNGDNVYSGTYYADGSQLYKTMQDLWYHYDVPGFPLGASLLFMNLGLQAGVQGDPDNAPRTEYQQMLGTYVNWHPKFMTLEGSYYRQMGKQVFNYVATKEIEAWMASIKATFKPSTRWNYTLGYDHLSGDSYVVVPEQGEIGLIDHKVIRGFTPLYGSHTKFYGILDYFYQSAYINGFTPGLQNAFAGVAWKPGEKFKGALTYHYLAVATDLDNLSRTLGHSLDLQLGYSFTKDISLTAGYTLMHGTETMDRLKQGKGSPFAHWGWFSLVVSPSLFTARW